MKRKSKGEIELDVLKHFATKKQDYMYPLHEHQLKSYIAARSTVHRAKDELLEKELITLDKEKIVNGRTRKIYRITKAGVLFLLSNKTIYKEDKKGLTIIDEIAENYADMFPLVFGKWDFFKKNKIKKDVIRRIIIAINGLRVVGESWYLGAADSEVSQKTINSIIEAKGEADAKSFVESHKEIMGDLTKAVYGFSISLSYTDYSIKNIERQKPFFEIVFRDPELRNYVMEQFDYYQKEMYQNYNNAKESKQWFQSLEEN